MTHTPANPRAKRPHPGRLLDCQKCQEYEQARENAAERRLYREGRI